MILTTILIGVAIFAGQPTTTTAKPTTQTRKRAKKSQEPTHITSKPKVTKTNKYTTLPPPNN